MSRHFRHIVCLSRTRTSRKLLLILRQTAPWVWLSSDEVLPTVDILSNQTDEVKKELDTRKWFFVPTTGMHFGAGNMAFNATPVHHHLDRLLGVAFLVSKQCANDRAEDLC